MKQLICKNVTLGYEGKAIIEGLSFTVNSGDYLCIVGENGSGKTTLMKTILKLQAPLAGSIETANGLEADKIGYLPQQTEVQRDFPASVREIVLSGCLNRCGIRPFYNKDEKALAAASMEKAEIAHLAKRCYRELSGGQQQRVLLARALCATRQMLLLDEPAAGLDARITEEIYALLEKINREDGITIIMITHDIDAAAKYASHILRIDTPCFFGTRDEYFKKLVSADYAEFADLNKLNKAHTQNGGDA